MSLAAALLAAALYLHADADGLTQGAAHGARDCQQAGGWHWGRGKAQPQRALQAHQALTVARVPVASVRVWRYGETDGCGVFYENAIDFDIALRAWSMPAPSRATTARATKPNRGRA